jgi:hypothetical protein
MVITKLLTVFDENERKPSTVSRAPTSSWKSFHLSLLTEAAPAKELTPQIAIGGKAITGGITPITS